MLRRDRSGQLEDPFGHLWWVATHKEDVSPEEMDRLRQQVLRNLIDETLEIQAAKAE